MKIWISQYMQYLYIILLLLDHSTEISVNELTLLCSIVHKMITVVSLRGCKSRKLGSDITMTWGNTISQSFTYKVPVDRARILIFSRKEGTAFISTYLSIRLYDCTTDSKRMRCVLEYRCRYLSALYLVLTYVTRECNVREFGTIIARCKTWRGNVTA